MWVTGASVVASAGNTPTANVYTNNRINGASYDGAGNQLVVNGNTLAYDAENRVTSAYDPVTHNTEDYLYDGNGRRVEKSIVGGTSTTYVYDAFGNLAAEYGAMQGTPPCTTCYLSYDWLGTVRMVTDASGTVKARHDFLPFGQEIPPNTAGRNGLWGSTADVEQKFTGKIRDQETGLDYFGARYYGNALGRFTSPDEFKGGIVDPFTGQDIETDTALPYADITDPQTLNKYAYVRNNPLRYTDPNGHCADVLTCTVEGSAIGEVVGGPVGAAVGGAIGGAVGGVLIYEGGRAVTDNFPSTTTTPGPYVGPIVQYSERRPGTLGKPDHQQTANEEAEKMGGRREVTIKTPGGKKESRRADAATEDENKNITGVTQVYRPTKGGNIPRREIDAANDIENATGVKPTMVPVRPVKPPCTPRAGGGCQQ